MGHGQFGTVNKGIWQSPGGAKEVAVKMLKPGAKEEDKVKFLQEAAINGQFKQPNVVNLMGVVTVGEPVSSAQFSKMTPVNYLCVWRTRKCNVTVAHIQVMIVLELLPNGDLRNYLMKQQPA